MKKQSLSSILLVLAMLVTGEILSKSKVYKGHQDEFDYIIVGFGSAGAILARKLSDGNKHSVLVLEAGPNNMEDPATLEPDIFLNFPALIQISYDPAFSASYPVPLPNSIAATVYTEGREWGGSAAHNYLQAVRPIPSDLNSWAANSGNSRWLYNNVLPLMKLLETYTPDGTIPNPSQRGFSGPIAITQNPPVDGNALAIATASVAGAPFVSDYNDATLSNVSTGAIQQFVTAGSDRRRSYSAYEFMTIGEQMDKKGRGLHGRKCRVMGNAVVSRILFDGKKAVGVQYLRNHASSKSEEVKKVYAKKKIILCAGSINTPKILIMSGVGPTAMVENIGVDLIVNSPQVGQNLQNQYGPAAIITNSTGPIPGGQLASFIDAQPYMPADSVRRIQIAGIDLGPIAQMIGFILQPSSRGSIEVVSKDPLIPAKLNMNMFSDGSFATVGSDAYLAVSYYKILQAIATAAGEFVLYPTADQYAGGDAALFQAALSAAALTMSSHIVGTARFGTSIANGVVDGNLNVYGVKNLMIADVSVENPITSANTCLGAYVIGMVAAQILGVAIPPVL